MIRRGFLLLVFLFLIAAHCLATSRAGRERKSLPVDLQTPAALPGPLLRISALEYKGVLADFLFLKAIVFFGSTQERSSPPRVTGDEWKWLLGIFNASTDLDPLFYDPYYVANAQLTWEAGMVKEANELLDKGRAVRTWDWLIPFHMGFNHFYFLEDHQRASELLMESSLKTGASPMIASLATRLAYQGERTANAITFLERLLANEEDEERRKDYLLRLDALRSIASIERAVAIFRERHLRAPLKIESLIEDHILQSLPRDPYGGEFYLDGAGRVRTTSDLRAMKKD